MASMNGTSLFNKNRSEHFACDGPTRRGFIGQGMACVLASVFKSQHSVSAAETGEPRPVAPVSNKLIYRSAAELARLVRAKTVSSEEVVRAHLDRIVAVNPRISAVVQLDSASALKTAREADAALAR
jgi:hypothetical protein